MRQRSSGPMPAVGSSSSNTLGFERQRERDIEQFLVAVGQDRGLDIGDLRQTHQLHHLVGAFMHTGRRKTVGQIAPLPEMGGNGGHQVFRHRHGRKAACHLERPPDAAVHPLRPGETNDVLTVEQHLAGSRPGTRR